MKTRTVIATSFITTVVVLVITIAAFALASPTMAQTPPSSQAPSFAGAPLAAPEGGGEKSWTAAGATFTDIWPSVAASGFELGACKYFLSGSADGTFAMAEVHLPYGATITSLTMYYMDSTAAANSELTLREYNFADRGYDILATLSTTGSSTSDRSVFIGLNVPVDNDNHFYILDYHAGFIGDQLCLCKVRIGYTVPNIFGYAFPAIIEK
jgi:hypothetical protein